MDDIDLYGDLDEFHQQQEKKSEELLQWENKYHESLVQIESLKDENIKLIKKIQKIEINFQNLLDTARAEIRRKQREIDNLRQEKEDLCFRRLRPSKQEIINNDPKQGERYDRNEKSLQNNCKKENHESKKNYQEKYTLSKQQYNERDKINHKLRSKSRSRSRSYSRNSKTHKRKRSNSPSRISSRHSHNNHKHSYKSNSHYKREDGYKSDRKLHYTKSKHSVNDEKYVKNDRQQSKHSFSKHIIGNNNVVDKSKTTKSQCFDGLFTSANEELNKNAVDADKSKNEKFKMKNDTCHTINKSTIKSSYSVIDINSATTISVDLEMTTNKSTNYKDTDLADEPNVKKSKSCEKILNYSIIEDVLQRSDSIKPEQPCVKISEDGENTLEKSSYNLNISDKHKDCKLLENHNEENSILNDIIIQAKSIDSSTNILHNNTTSEKKMNIDCEHKEIEYERYSEISQAIILPHNQKDSFSNHNREMGEENHGSKVHQGTKNIDRALNDSQNHIDKNSVEISAEFNEHIIAAVVTDAAELSPELPCIKNIPSLPTNFSGIFTQKLVDTSKKSQNLKSNSTAHKTCRTTEYILPAASVLCNIDNLESATKKTKHGLNKSSQCIKNCIKSQNTENKTTSQCNNKVKDTEQELISLEADENIKMIETIQKAGEPRGYKDEEESTKEITKKLITIDSTKNTTILQKSLEKKYEYKKNKKTLLPSKIPKIHIKMKKTKVNAKQKVEIKRKSKSENELKIKNLNTIVELKSDKKNTSETIAKEYNKSPDSPKKQYNLRRYGLINKLEESNCNLTFNYENMEEKEVIKEGHSSIQTISANINNNNKNSCLEKQMYKMFHSPQNNEIIESKENNNLQQQQQPNNINKNPINLINESNIISKNEDINGSLQTNQCLTNCTNELNLSSTRVEKYVSLGTSQYRFEKISDNIVNLFISRKHKRRKKSVANNQSLCVTSSV